MVELERGGHDLRRALHQLVERQPAERGLAERGDRALMVLGALELGDVLCEALDAAVGGGQQLRGDRARRRLLPEQGDGACLGRLRAITGSGVPVMSTTRAPGAVPSARSRRQTSIPLRPGIRTSRSATSGWHATIPASAGLAVGRLADDLERRVLGHQPRDPRLVAVVVVGDEHPPQGGPVCDVARTEGSHGSPSGPFRRLEIFSLPARLPRAPRRGPACRSPARP